MKGKGFWLAVVVAFVALAALDYVIHDVLLRGDYQAVSTLVRPEIQVGPVLVGELVFAFLFTWIYTKGYEPGRPPLGQGIRYGLALGALYWGAGSIIHYGVIPVGGGLTVKWIVFGLIETAILGALVASLYKPAAQAAA